MNRFWPAVRRLAGVLLLTGVLPACGGGSSYGTLNPTVAPQIPTGVSGVGAPLRSVLRWTKSPIATSYKVRRSLFSGGPYQDIPGATALTEPAFRDLGLQNGTAYYYVVSASNSFGSSPESLEIKVVPDFKADQIAGGGDFTVALMKDGSVWAWGVNDFGQLGFAAPPVISTVAVEVPLPEPVIAVVAADRHCLALTVDGRVYAWGDNTALQLGNAGPSTHVPAEIVGLTGVRVISAFYQSSLALMADGTVKAWGDNTYGQLGVGVGASTEIPTPVPGLTDIVAISAGAGFNLAVRSDGTVAAWGYNDPYLLGTGETFPPFGAVVSVANLDHVVAVSAGYNHATALTEDGIVWTWGTNDRGELGVGLDPQFSAYRMQVLGLPPIVGIATGEPQTLCAAADGSVWSWGFNGKGAVGVPANPSSASEITPRQVTGVGSIAAVSAGWFHSLALGDDGTIWGWGADDYGALGNGGGGTQLAPIAVPQLDSIAAVSSRFDESVARRNDGTVWAWSQNRWGQSGNGMTTTTVMEPVRSGDLTGIVAVSAGGEFNAALKNDGTVWTWGYNDYGQLGKGYSPLYSSWPTPIPALTDVTALSMGYSYGLALKGSDGQVWGWGFASYGVLGTGMVNQVEFVPVPVVTQGPSGLIPLTGVTAIAAGSTTSLALRSDQTVWGWGLNWNGELGVPFATLAVSYEAIQIPGLSGITAISTCVGWNLALKSDGTVWAWGDNSAGQLGLDPNAVPYSEIPAPIGGLSGIVAIAAGGRHGVALKGDGTVWNWGHNGFGQLGVGDLVYRHVPVQVTGLTGATSVTAGDFFSLAILQDGHVVGWGSNGQGQLAIYPSSSAFTPIEITR